MILVTVGTQIPFDRLAESVDEWVESVNQVNQVNQVRQIVAQVGKSKFKSDNMTVFQSVEPEQFEKYIAQCNVLVSHAGMGSILTALRVKKPIIIFPRKASLNEHRNDHQLATSESFANVDGVYVAKSKDELFDLLNRKDELVSGGLNDSDEYIRLINNIEKIPI